MNKKLEFGAPVLVASGMAGGKWKIPGPGTPGYSFGDGTIWRDDYHGLYRFVMRIGGTIGGCGYAEKPLDGKPWDWSAITMPGGPENPVKAFPTGYNAVNAVNVDAISGFTNPYTGVVTVVHTSNPGNIASFAGYTGRVNIIQRRTSKTPHSGILLTGETGWNHFGADSVVEAVGTLPGWTGAAWHEPRPAGGSALTGGLDESSICYDPLNDRVLVAYEAKSIGTVQWTESWKNRIGLLEAPMASFDSAPSFSHLPTLTNTSWTIDPEDDPGYVTQASGLTPIWGTMPGLTQRGHLSIAPDGVWWFVFIGQTPSQFAGERNQSTAVGLLYSTDEGQTWFQMEGNPVIVPGLFGLSTLNSGNWVNSPFLIHEPGFVHLGCWCNHAGNDVINDPDTELYMMTATVPSVSNPTPAARVPTPLRPIWRDNVRVTTAYQTAIRTEQKKGGEVRRALQKRPVRTVELTTTSADRDMSLHAWVAAARRGQVRKPVPLYSDHSKLTAAYTGGSTVLDLDTRWRRFYPGQRIQVIDVGRGPGVPSHIFDVTEVQDSQITVTTNTSFGAPSFAKNARVYPLIDAEISLQSSAQLNSDHLAELATVFLEVQGTSALPPWWEGPIDAIYEMRADSSGEDEPIWDVPANWTAPVSFGLSRQGERYRSGKAYATEVDAERPTVLPAFTVRFTSRAEVFRFLSLFDWAIGSTKPFWFVSHLTTWELVSYGPSSIFITAPAGGDISDVAELFSYVAVKDKATGRHLIWDIASVVDNGATWTINIVPDPDIAFPSIAGTSRVAPAHHVRFSADEITEVWHTDETCDIAISLNELLDETARPLINAVATVKSAPENVPDLFFWMDPTRNVYHNRTTDPVVQSYVEAVGWPHMHYHADVILDARRNLGRSIRKGEGIPLPYVSGELVSLVDPPYVVQGVGPEYLGGARALVNTAAHWGAVVEGGHPIEDSILWDNAKGMTIIVLVVQSSAGPWATPQNIIRIREGNPTIPVFEWHLAGVGSASDGRAQFFDAGGNVISTVQQIGIDNWSLSGLGTRVIPVVLRWHPTRPAHGRYIVGGSAAAGATWSPSISSIRIPRPIQLNQWFTMFNTKLGDPAFEGNLVKGSQAVRAVFANTAMLGSFIVYKRGIEDFELNAIMAEFRDQFGLPFDWSDL